MQRRTDFGRQMIAGQWAIAEFNASRSCGRGDCRCPIPSSSTRPRCSWRTHGDLSPYNVLVRDDELVIIDWPQVIDILGNPQGFELLERDVRTMCAWFERRGLGVDVETLFGDCAALAAGR